MAEITYTDKVQGQANSAPTVQQFQFTDANEIKTVVNVNAALFDALLEQKMLSALVEVTVVSGAYTFAVSDARRFVIPITEATTLTIPTLDVSTSLVFAADVSGNFTLTLPSVTALGDDYDGTLTNRLTFDCYREAGGSQVNKVTIENIA